MNEVRRTGSVLVNDRAPSVAKNPNAATCPNAPNWVGQYPEARTKRDPSQSLMPVDRPGVPAAKDWYVRSRNRHGRGGTGQRTTVLRKKFSTSPRPPRKGPALRCRCCSKKRPDLAMTPNDDGVELRMRGERSTKLWIAADTQRIRRRGVPGQLAPQDLERVGTNDFPTLRAARSSPAPGDRGDDRRRRQTAANHRPAQQRTCGTRRAAMRILKLAAPFDPFPSDLSSSMIKYALLTSGNSSEAASQGGACSTQNPTSPDESNHP